MVELYLMASHGYLPGLGVIFHPEQGFTRLCKDAHHLAPFLHMPNQDIVNPPSFHLSLQQREQLKSIFDYNQFARIDSSSRRPTPIDVQDAHADSALFSFGIAEHFARREKILKLLTSGTIEVEDDSLNVSMLYELIGPQPLMTDIPPQPFSYSRCFSDDAEPQAALLYPNREFYFKEPFLDLVRHRTGCSDNAYNSDGQRQFNCFGIEIDGILSDISDFYFSRNTSNACKQAMLVPYFERQRRSRANTNSSKLATEKVEPLKINENSKEKQRRKKTSPRTSKERDIYANSSLHACESLLSIIFERKHQNKTVIASLKKSSPELSQLLTQFSASIAGTGIAVVLSVICRVACTRVPLCASKLLSTGLGLGLVWLSWAVNRLRDTVFAIGKTSGKFKEKEEEMMNQLDRNLKDIYFRAMALLAVAVLQLV